MYSLRSWRMAVVQPHRQNVKLIHTSYTCHYTNRNISDSWAKVGSIGEPEDITRFVHQIGTGTAGCVSDGSAKWGKTATAFTSLQENDNDKPAFVGSFCIPGRPEDQDSYRSELAGILGIIMTVNLICIQCNIITGKVTVGCDNKSALWTSFGKAPININRSSRDILQAIHHQINISPVEWASRHVKGHQDDTDKQLDSWEKANVKMDEEAKQTRESADDAPLHSILAREKWRLYLNDTAITGKYKQALDLHCNYDRAIQYWSRRGHFDKEQASSIDWRSHAKAFRNLKPSARKALTKLFAGVHATGKVML